jgi:UDP-glucose 4-epimerase
MSTQQVSNAGLKVLVTGAAGFIGHHIVKLLLKNGYTVVGLDNLSTGDLANIPASQPGGAFQFVKGDVANAGTVAEAMRGCTHVVHLAGLASVPVSVQEPELTFQTNVVGTENILAAARTQQLQGWVLLASSAAVYGQMATDKPSNEALADSAWPPSPYAASKRMNECQALSYRSSYKVNTLALRFFNVYGAGQKLGPSANFLTRVADSITNGSLVTIYGDGKQLRDFVAVGDVALAVGKLLARPVSAATPPAVNVGSGVATSLLDAIRHMVAIKQVNPGVEYRAAREGDASFSCAEIGALQQLIPGWEPQPLADGLRGWLQSH